MRWSSSCGGWRRPHPSRDAPMGNRGFLRPAGEREGHEAPYGGPARRARAAGKHTRVRTDGRSHVEFRTLPVTVAEAGSGRPAPTAPNPR